MRVYVPYARSGPRTRTLELGDLACRCSSYKGLADAGGAVTGTYSAVRNFQSGATGSDVVSGAGAGAAVGGAIATGATAGSVFPIVGTVIGALVGAAAFALASAFGGGRHDPETTEWNSFIAAYQQNHDLVWQLSAPQAFQMLAGIMDAKNNTPGHSSALELSFGRMAEGSVIVQMANLINAATRAGEVTGTDTPASIYTRIVVPWLQSRNAYIGENDVLSSNGSRNDGAVDGLFQILIAAWVTGWLKASTPMGAQGQPIAGLPAFVGLPKAAAAAAAAAPAAVPYVSPTASSPAPQVTGTTATGTPIVPADQTSALIQGLLAQGQSQQQAYQAALASLQAGGVNTQSPEVQSQVASAVQQAAAAPATGAAPVSQAGLSPLEMILVIGVGVSLLFGGMKAPKSKGMKR